MSADLATIHKRFVARWVDTLVNGGIDTVSADDLHLHEVQQHRQREANLAKEWLASLRRYRLTGREIVEQVSTLPEVIYPNKVADIGVNLCALAQLSKNPTVMVDYERFLAGTISESRFLVTLKLAGEA